MIDFVAYCVFMGFALFIARSALVKVKHYKHDVTPAEQIRLCVWYYDICNDSDKNPKHEAWTDEGKAMLTEWVRDKFPAELIGDLPGDVGEWVRRVKQ
jgi:hypothetical protein